MTTFCEDCDHVHPSSRKKPATYWLCMAFKRIRGGSFVAPTEWADNEPYMRCIGINGGACPMYTPLRVAGEFNQDVIE